MTPATVSFVRYIRAHSLTSIDYMDIIKDAVDCAFGMAELARIELNRAPMASHIDQIYTWIFRDTSLPQNPAIEEVHLDYLRSMLKAISHYHHY